MRTIKTIDYAIRDIIDTVVNEGKRTKVGIWQATELFQDQEMMVKRNIAIEGVMIPNNIETLQKLTQCDLPWAEDHFRERVGGEPTNPGHTYKYWPYNTFKDEEDPYKHGKIFSHTYQERFWPKWAGENKWAREVNINDSNKGVRHIFGDLDDVITQLKRNPLTRQAYLPIFFPEDTGARHGQRVPCTLGYYFYIEDGELHITYTIRSCDVFRHLRNDIYFTGRLLQFMAADIGCKVGTMTFIGFNVHVFINDMYALTKRERKIENDRKL